MLILFNKPYGVLSQFSIGTTDANHSQTLAHYGLPAGVYAAGRLDKDSEGLLVLSDDGRLQAKLSHPKHKTPKTYWVQVEGIPDDAALAALRDGVMLKDGKTRPAKVQAIDPPCHLWPRSLPIRQRKTVPDCWISLTLREGRNRQVRRMSAAVGHPTLRLIRAQIGQWHLNDLRPGEWQKVD